MSVLLYVVMYLLLVVNLLAVFNVFFDVLDDADMDDSGLVWFILAGLLTPLNLIWLASL